MAPFDAKMAMSTLRMRPLDLPPLPKSVARKTWIDIAKGISIVLVVTWHFFDQTAYLNQLFAFSRMPLFFLVAGFFMRKHVTLPYGAFFRGRLMDFLYLYILWSFLVKFLTEFIWGLMKGKVFNMGYMLHIFTEPPLTIWFLYSLAIALFVFYLVRSLPIALIAVLGSIAYWLSFDYSRDFGMGLINQEFTHKTVRLIPYFICGAVLFRQIDEILERYYKFAVVLLPLYSVFAIFAVRSGLAQRPSIAIPLAILGVATLLSTARCLADMRIGQAARFVGIHSLYIFLLHRVFEHWVFGGFKVVFKPEQIAANLHLVQFTMIVVVIGLILIVTPFIKKVPALAFLFQRPRWLLPASRASSSESTPGTAPEKTRQTL